MATLINGGRQIADNVVGSNKLVPSVRAQLSNADTALSNSLVLASQITDINASLVNASSSITTTFNGFDTTLAGVSSSINDIVTSLSTDSERVAAFNELQNNVTAADNVIGGNITTIGVSLNTYTGASDPTFVVTNIHGKSEVLGVSTAIPSIKTAIVDVFTSVDDQITTGVMPRLALLESALGEYVESHEMFYTVHLTPVSAGSSSFAGNIGLGKTAVTGKMALRMNTQLLDPADDYIIDTFDDVLSITLTGSYDTSYGNKLTAVLPLQSRFQAPSSNTTWSGVGVGNGDVYTPSTYADAGTLDLTTAVVTVNGYPATQGTDYTIANVAGVVQITLVNAVGDGHDKVNFTCQPSSGGNPNNYPSNTVYYGDDYGGDNIFLLRPVVDATTLNFSTASVLINGAPATLGVDYDIKMVPTVNGFEAAVYGKGRPFGNADFIQLNVSTVTNFLSNTHYEQRHPWDTDPIQYGYALNNFVSAEWVSFSSSEVYINGVLAVWGTDYVYDYEESDLGNKLFITPMLSAEGPANLNIYIYVHKGNGTLGSGGPMNSEEPPPPEELPPTEEPPPQ